ncbi:MAG: Ada metal-binding domain-containing protein, partial [Anaerolineae bacterium]|nr:Ada metal-binding domain-containing protein [Anaerolineae bacterium]
MEQRNKITFLTDDARWEALVRREPQAVDSFVYGVVTTGIYCRPTCASRIPKRENVRFFDSWQEAERAGFRPCKRCMPNRPEAETTQAEAILRACKLIDVAETPPSLNDLAAAAGLSPFHFHRLFKKIVGSTPKQYAIEKRAERMR